MKTLRILSFVIKCAVAVAAVSVLLVLFTPLGAFLAIGGESFLTKAHIDNQYVDADYPQWHKVQVDDLKPLYIPAGWELEESADFLLIKDASGSVWAYGGRYGEGTGQFHDTSSLISAFHDDICVTDYAVDYSWGTIAMEESSLLRASVCAENSNQKFYKLYLHEEDNRSICFIITADLEQRATDFDIAEAILYSFAYGS